jgi:hypothetical protein
MQLLPEDYVGEWNPNLHMTEYEGGDYAHAEGGFGENIMLIFPIGHANQWITVYYTVNFLGGLDVNMTCLYGCSHYGFVSAHLDAWGGLGEKEWSMSTWYTVEYYRAGWHTAGTPYDKPIILQHDYQIGPTGLLSLGHGIHARIDAVLENSTLMSPNDSRLVPYPWVHFSFVPVVSDFTIFGTFVSEDTKALALSEQDPNNQITDFEIYTSGGGTWPIENEPILKVEKNADFNKDGYVDSSDLVRVAEQWLDSASIGDFDLNGKVDNLDLMLLSQSWLSDPDSREWNPVCDIYSHGDDETINIQDFAVFADCYTDSIPVPSADITPYSGDGNVDFFDFSKYASQYLSEIPENDDCQDAIEIGIGQAYPGSTATASGSSQSTCSLGDTHDVWYSLTPDSNESVEVILFDCDFPATLSLYDDCNGVELDCSMGQDHTKFEIDLIGGTTYFIRVAGFQGTEGRYTLLVDRIIPDNDECQDAHVVHYGEVYLGSTVGATGTGESNYSSYDNLDVWHSYTADTNGLVTISLYGSSISASLAVYDQCGGTELACNIYDRYAPHCGDIGELSLEVTAGEVYMIRVACSDSLTGDYTLLIDAPDEPLANDECQDARVIYDGEIYLGSTCNATGTDESSCAYDDNNDVWYSYMPDSSGLATISLRGSSFNTTLAIYDQCGGTELACNDDPAQYGYQPKLNIVMTAGEVYMIRVAGSDGQTGDYALVVNGPGQSLTNDECQDAHVVYDGEIYVGSTVGVTGTDESSCGAIDTFDVWHYYTPASNGMATISLCGSSFDTTLAIFDQCGGTELACNDDSCGLQSEINLEVTTGGLYLIRVAGYGGQTGDYSLLVDGPDGPPANDECHDAHVINNGEIYSGSTFDATDEGCEYDDRFDVWHSFTPLNTASYIISLCGSDFDTTLEVYDSCGPDSCGGGTIDYNDDYCDTQSQLTIDLEAGQTYLIQVAGYGGETGNYTLTVIGPPDPPKNDECDQAIAVNIGEVYTGSTIGVTGTAESSCSFNDTLDVWHSFTPVNTASYTISLCGSDLDTTLSVWDSCGGEEIGCNDDYCDYQSELTIDLTAGQTYLIRVAGYDGETGTYTLSLAEAPE